MRPFREGHPADGQAAGDLDEVGTGSRTAYARSLLALLVAAVAARVLYFTYGQVRFDAKPLDDYFQFVDPLLLKNDLLQTVLHLHSQPPLFNVFLGLMLKALPGHLELALNVVYVCAGIALILAMFHLMLRLGVSPNLSALTTAVFAVGPVTMLYENWLYPTYLVAAMLPLATLMLHRYLVRARLRDAAGFFAILGIVVLTLGLFHPVWLIAAAIALLVALPGLRSRTTVAFAIPLVVVIGASVFQLLQFGSWTFGSVYQDLNLAQMTTLRLPEATRERLIRTGKISPINRLSIYTSTPADYAEHIPWPDPTGVAVLDQRVKSNGATNWHSAAFLRVAARYGEDAGYVRREYPGVYASSIARNARRFFLPADQSYPFANLPPLRSDALTPRMVPLVRGWDIVLSGQLQDQGIAVGNIIAISASLVFGILFVLRSFSRRKRRSPTRAAPIARADALTVLFMIYTVLYVGVVAITLSSDDQSRYRFMTAPLVCVMLGMLLSEAARRLRPQATQGGTRPRALNWTKG